MRLRFVLLALLLCLAACGDDERTLIAGDTAADADSSDDATSSVGNDSAPVALGPSTTAPWSVTLGDHPLLRLMHETETDAQIGSTWFVMVDDEAEAKPVASGSEAFPHFVVRLDAWYGVENYVEFTISTTNAKAVDDQPSGLQCNNNFASFAQIDSSRFERRPNTLPEVLGTTLVWDAAACSEASEVDYDALFEGEVEIDVAATGFLLTKPDALAQTYRFEMLAPLPPQNTGTPPVVETTTTTVGPSS